jgi:hypothetical protein
VPALGPRPKIAPAVPFALPLLVLLAPLLVPSSAHACSCVLPTVESSYDNSDDVIEARVLLSLPVGDERWLVARVQATFKGCLEERELVLLTTPSSSAACGATLQNGQTYLVNGTSDGSALGIDRLLIGLCGYNPPLTELTPRDQAFLAGREVCCGGECSCANGEQPVQCFAQPCSVAPACAEAAVCVDNYCGGCNAEFRDAFGNAVCQASSPCSSDVNCAADHWCRQALWLRSDAGAVAVSERRRAVSARPRRAADEGLGAIARRTTPGGPS